MSEKPSPMTVYDGQTAVGEVEDHGPRKILAFATSPLGRRIPLGPSATGGPPSGQSRPPHAGPRGKPGWHRKRERQSDAEHLDRIECEFGIRASFVAPFPCLHGHRGDNPGSASGDACAHLAIDHAERAVHELLKR
jgi:hypothetical protein